MLPQPVFRPQNLHSQLQQGEEERERSEIVRELLEMLGQEVVISIWFEMKMLKLLVVKL